MDPYLLMKIYNDKNSYFSLNKNVFQLCASYTLLNEDIIVKLQKLNQKKYLNLVIYENKQLWEFVWLKYIATRLPQYKNFLDLKMLCIKGIKIYHEYIENTLKIPNIQLYDVLYKNTLYTTNIYNNIKNFPSSNHFSENLLHNKKIDGFKLPKNMVYTNQKTVNSSNIFECALSHKKYLAAHILFDQTNASYNLYESLIENTEFFNYLVDKKCSIDIQDCWGDTVLIHALKNVYNHKYFENVRTIVEKGANINIKNNKGNTPLIFACRTNNLDVIKYLLNKGADINAKNNLGTTALHKALHYMNSDVAKFLILNGINIKKDYVNSSNIYKNPLLKAVQNSDTSIAKNLIQNGCTIDNEMFYWIKTPKMRKLLDQYFNI